MSISQYVLSYDRKSLLNILCISKYTSLTRNTFRTGGHDKFFDHLIAEEHKLSTHTYALRTVYSKFALFVSCCHDDTRICEGEKVHSMRVCFVRPRNFPAMSIFFPPCQDLLCEVAGFCACCERTNNFCL